MCGINGIYNYSGIALQNANSLIKRMNESIRHRGPDDEGIWSDTNDKIHFGHLRLSIIDLSAGGHQPMQTEKGTSVVFNGEIYNYNEIRPLTGIHSYRSSSDTEVILRMYEKFGVECLKYFNGMFAFAIWDTEKEEIFLARDRAGKKPLYYTNQNGVFAFSSEIKSLLTLPWVKAELDEEAFYHFLTFNLLPPPLTMFKNIFKFHPGHKMIVNKGGIKNYQPYWEVEYQDLKNEKPELLEQKIFDGLEKSVAYRMIADVPVGAFLSGGVDSSALVAMMSMMSSHPVKTYSIGFKNQPEYDELEFARKVSKMFSTEHHEKIVSAEDIKNFLPNVVEIFDEPLADATCIPIYFISQKAKEMGTKAVLTGDGSDELFAGYNNYKRYLKHYPHFYLYSKFPNSIKKVFSQLFSLHDDSSPLSDMLHRAAHNQEFFWGGAKSFKESTKKNFLNKNFSERTARLNSHDVIKDYRKLFNKIPNHPQNDIDWMCYLGFKFTDTNHYLYRADRLGMAHSIETRAPFLDYEFVNLALSIPGNYKLKNGEPKYILKKALERILPKEILYRKKMGFCVPLQEWGGEVMTDFVESNLKSFCNNTGLFDEKGIRRLLYQVKNENERGTNDLWTIYFLIAWFKKWLGA